VALEFGGDGKLSGAPFESGYAKASFPQPELGTVDVELGTDRGNIKLTNKTRVEGLVAVLSGDTKDESVNLDLEFGRDLFTAKTEVKTKLAGYATGVKVGLSAGQDGYTAGVFADLDLSAEQALSDYSVAFEGVVRDTTISLISTKQLSKVSGGVFYSYNPSTQVGFQLNYDVPPEQQEESKAAVPPWDASAAVQRRLDDRTSVKLAVTLPSGLVRSSIEHRLANPNLKLGFAASFNTRGGNLRSASYGISLDFGK